MRFILSCCTLIILLTGCDANTSIPKEKDPLLYPEPVTVPLNLTGGYKINFLTGDSIKPLINSLGDTVQTGVPLRID